MAYEKDTYLEMIARGITYDEMLKLDEKDFQNLLCVRNEYNREKLLEEMIKHEEGTGSFRKTAKEEVSGGEQALLDVFDGKKSTKIVETFEKVKKVLTEGKKEGIDLVEHAIFAKAASDYVLLNIGDKVIVKNEGTAEIIEISVSSDGLKKYKVKLEKKSNSLDPSPKEEWFLSNDLVRFYG